MIAESGQRLNQEVIDNIVDNAEANCPHPQFHILLLGDNNLRGGLEPMDSYVRKCERLANSLKRIPNCHLVLTSVLPSLETQENFFEANRKIRDICYNSNGHVTFIDFDGVFTRNGAINYKLYADGKHLNSKGSVSLAKMIYEHCVLSMYNFTYLSRIPLHGYRLVGVWFLLTLGVISSLGA